MVYDNSTFDFSREAGGGGEGGEVSLTSPTMRIVSHNEQRPSWRTDQEKIKDWEIAYRIMLMGPMGSVLNEIIMNQTQGFVRIIAVVVSISSS